MCLSPLQRLPEHAADELLALVLQRHGATLTPAQLELFRHAATSVALPPGPLSGPAWLAGVSDFRQVAPLPSVSPLRRKASSSLTVCGCGSNRYPANTSTGCVPTHTAAAARPPALCAAHLPLARPGGVSQSVSQAGKAGRHR